jgi:Fic family protein
MTDLTLRQADHLYQGFPDFADWPAPKEDDLRLWDRFASTLQEIRAKATPEALKRAVDVAVRAAALDTGAIEGLYSVDRGFTMTVATQALAWEHAIAEKGENVRDLFEAQLQAYELVIDAVTGHHPVSEAWIRALHETLCGPQTAYRVLTDQGWQEQELRKGAYKTQPNHVRLADGSFHAYAPVDRVAPEMHRLLEQVRTPGFESAHPISQASYIHYGFVVIHPFADGNGRVARALASVFFYKALSIPFLVFANQRAAYFDVLHRADLGSPGPLLAFFRDRGIDTTQLVVEHLLTAQAPAPKEMAARLHQEPPVRLQDIENTAQRLHFAATRQLVKQSEELQFPDHLSPYVAHVRGHWAANSGYLPIDSDVIEISLRSGYRTVLSSKAKILRALDMSNPFLFLLDSRNERLEIRYDDAYPEISETLQLRLANWARRILGRLLQELQEPH